MPVLSSSLTIKLEDKIFLIWKNQLFNMIMVNGLENNIKIVQPLEFLDHERKIENSKFVTW